MYFAVPNTGGMLCLKVIEMVKAKAGMRLDADGFALFQIVKERG